MKSVKLKTWLSAVFLLCFAAVGVFLNHAADGAAHSKKDAAGNSVLANADAQTLAQGAAKRQTVILDAGHGGEDPGCVGMNGELEKDINLKITLDLAELLKTAGFDVILTRDKDESIHSGDAKTARQRKKSDMENRKKIIDRNTDGIFLSIHQNRFTSPDSFGAQIFYTVKNQDNVTLASSLQKRFAELQPENTREVKLIDNNLFLFRETVQPAVLIECGFLSNKDDAQNLGDEEYQKKVAMTIFKGLTDYLSNADA